MTFWQFMGYTLWVFLLMTFISVLIWVLMDMFRRPDLRGIAKAGWLLLIIVLPVIGSLIYMIFRPPIEPVALPSSAATYPSGGEPKSQAEQLRILSDLRDGGKLSDTEYESAKSQVITGRAAPAPRPTPT